MGSRSFRTVSSLLKTLGQAQSIIPSEKQTNKQGPLSSLSIQALTGSLSGLFLRPHPGNYSTRGHPGQLRKHLYVYIYIYVCMWLLGAVCAVWVQIGQWKLCRLRWHVFIALMRANRINTFNQGLSQEYKPIWTWGAN